jgi:2-octaprenyl-6-methoxyphenol hydroxylase
MHEASRFNHPVVRKGMAIAPVPANIRPSTKAAPDHDMLYDLVVAGAGLNGLVLALAARKTLRLDVALCDPALGRPSRMSTRAYAIAAGPLRFLKKLNLWDGLAPHAQPILTMTITDSHPRDALRQSLLKFSGDVAPGEPYAQMIEERHLLPVVLAAAREAGITFLPQPIKPVVEPQDDALPLHLGNAQTIHTRLLVAADGAASPCRDMLGIGKVGWDYGQTALVATVTHERDHEGRAIEHFLPSGPFAILPLPGRRSSIVWSEKADEARHLLDGPPDSLFAELERRFGLEWGDIRLETPVHAYPLRLMIARSFIAHRAALIGDAAHVIHPIAGQGLNLGLQDAQSLIAALAEAKANGTDIGSRPVLRRYERDRRFETVTMGIVTDGLNRLFTTDALPVRLARDLGLGIVERLPALKSLLIRQAAGL